MARKSKKASRIDLATEDMLLAEEDVAAMRPALAVAPELVVQTIQAARKRAARRRAKKKATARKAAIKKTRKAVPKKKKRVAAARKKSPARKK